MKRRDFVRSMAIAPGSLAIPGLFNSAQANPLAWIVRGLFRLLIGTGGRRIGQALASSALRRITFNRALLAVDAISIAALIPDLVHALENFEPLEQDEPKPNIWLKDGENPLVIKGINLEGDYIRDHLHLSLVDYYSKSSLGEINKIEIKIRKEAQNLIFDHKLPIHGLPQHIPLGTFVQVRGELPNYPDVIIDDSPAILVGDSNSVQFRNNFG